MLVDRRIVDMCSLCHLLSLCTLCTTDPDAVSSHGQPPTCFLTVSVINCAVAEELKRAQSELKLTDMFK
jgi:hypothetical protein